ASGLIRAPPLLGDLHHRVSRGSERQPGIIVGLRLPTSPRSLKEVLAVPGDIDRPVSRGCNLLIRDGAHPVLGVDDLVELLSFALGPPPRQLSNRTSAQGVTIEAALAQSEASVGETLADLIRRQLSE
ncbi:MAG: hypothetical protein ACR2NT_01865, partial [Acidimicrobiia bacterium]